MIGFQAEVLGYEGQQSAGLTCISGSAIAPGFFAWVIPSGFGSHQNWCSGRLPRRLNGRSVEQCYDDLLQSSTLWEEKRSEGYQRDCPVLRADSERYGQEKRYGNRCDAYSVMLLEWPNRLLEGGIGPGI